MYFIYLLLKSKLQNIFDFCVKNQLQIIFGSNTFFLIAPEYIVFLNDINALLKLLLTSVELIVAFFSASILIKKYIKQIFTKKENE